MSVSWVLLWAVESYHVSFYLQFTLIMWVDSLIMLIHVKYFQARNIITQVKIMPPKRMILSWLARFSINLITVFDKPSVFAMSRIFLWAPLSVIRCSLRLDKMFPPLFISSSMPRWESVNRWFCCNAASIMMDVDESLASNLRFSNASLSRSSSALRYLEFINIKHDKPPFWDQCKFLTSDLVICDDIHNKIHMTMMTLLSNVNVI